MSDVQLMSLSMNNNNHSKFFCPSFVDDIFITHRQASFIFNSTKLCPVAVLPQIHYHLHWAKKTCNRSQTPLVEGVHIQTDLNQRWGEMTNCSIKCLGSLLNFHPQHVVFETYGKPLPPWLSSKPCCFFHPRKYHL